MASEYNRRFSLDKVEIDPKLKNRIFSADGDEHVGDWDGETIEDLIKELDRVEENVDANYASLPHHNNVPEDLRDQVEKDFPIWACDRQGMCLVGDQANEVISIEKIRSHYDNKHGGVEAFKEKLRLERQKMIEDLNRK